MKSFEKPQVEVVSFNSSIITASSCGCFDAMFCATNYTNCTGDGATCSCQINYNPAIANCICEKVE